MIWNIYKIILFKLRGIIIILLIKVDIYLEELVVKGNRKVFLCFFKQNFIYLVRVSFEKI